MKIFLEKLLQFLSSSSGELSSKRLTFIASAVIYSIGSVGFVAYLIHEGQYQEALELWNSFGLFTGLSGGLVTAELFQKKDKNDKSI